MSELPYGKNGAHSSGTVAAIIWDYDGTLVDTRQKNLNVTQTIIRETTGADPKAFSALRSLESYTHAMSQSTNWRDFYTKEFGLNDAETDVVGKKWTEFQRRDVTPTSVFDGIRDVMYRLQDIPHGIVSQNSREEIVQVLKENDLLQYFGFIVGFQEVELRRQKPEPDGLLRCIDELTRREGVSALYIGDHESDIVVARNANNVLERNGSRLRIRSIGAMYSSRQDYSHWHIKADYEARQVHDIIEVVESLKSLAVLRQ